MPELVENTKKDIARISRLDLRRLFLAYPNNRLNDNLPSDTVPEDSKKKLKFYFRKKRKKKKQCGARTRGPQIKSLMLCQTELIGRCALWGGVEPPIFCKAGASGGTQTPQQDETCGSASNLRAFNFASLADSEWWHAQLQPLPSQKKVNPCGSAAGRASRTQRFAPTTLAPGLATPRSLCHCLCSHGVPTSLCSRSPLCGIRTPRGCRRCPP